MQQHNFLERCCYAWCFAETVSWSAPAKEKLASEHGFRLLRLPISVLFPQAGVGRLKQGTKTAVSGRQWPQCSASSLYFCGKGKLDKPVLLDVPEQRP